MKKILILIFIFLVIIVGCSNQTKDINNDNVKIIALSDKDKLMVGKVNDEVNIFDYSLDQLAVIENYKNKNYSILNKYIYSNDLDKINYIYDMTGNELYSVKGSVLSVSKSGYALIKKIKKDKVIYEIVDIFTKKTKKKYKFDGINNDIISYGLYKDYFIIDNDISLDLYDAKENITYKQYPTNREYLEKENNALENETLPYLDNTGKILSLKNDLYYDNNIIYDGDKKELKKLDGVKYIYYYDNKLFVYSNDTISILDDNLNYIIKPLKIDNTYFNDLKNYDDSINSVINFDKVNQDLNVRITNRAIYIIKSIDNYFEITILDNETLKKIKKYKVKVKKIDDIRLTQNGIIVTDDSNRNYLYCEEGKKKLSDGKVKIYSDYIITIKNENDGVIYNLNKKRSLNIK